MQWFRCGLLHVGPCSIYPQNPLHLLLNRGVERARDIKKEREELRKMEGGRRKREMVEWKNERMAGGGRERERAFI